MEIFSILDNKYAIATLSAIGGIALTYFTQLILNKRGKLTYSVSHLQLGVSADDKVFGSIRVTWNGNDVANLFSSTVELINESYKDYENVKIRAYTGNSDILSERTEIVGTTHTIAWSDEYQNFMKVKANASPTKEQLDRYYHNREYRAPTINRGQVIRFNFLTATTTTQQPAVWLDIVHKGLKLKFHVKPKQIFGVAQNSAGWIGTVFSFIFVGILISFVDSLWIVALSSVVCGLLAQLPGVGIIQVWTGFKKMVGD
jgi:hypothetical protein